MVQFHFKKWLSLREKKVNPQKIVRGKINESGFHHLDCARYSHVMASMTGRSELQKHKWG